MEFVSEVVSAPVGILQNMLKEKDKELTKLKMKVTEFETVHEELKNFLEKQTTCQKCKKKFGAERAPYILSCNHVVCGICLNIEKKYTIDIEALYMEFTNIADEIRLASEEVENKKQILDNAEKEKIESTKVCPSALDILRAKVDISFRQEAKIAQQKTIEEMEQKCERLEVSLQKLKDAEEAYNTAVGHLNRLKTTSTKKDKNIKQIITNDWYTKKCPICDHTVKALILYKFIAEYNAFESELKDKYLKIERSTFEFGKNRNSKKSVRKNMKKSVRKNMKKSVRKTKNLRKSAVKSTKKKSRKTKSRKTRKSRRR